MNVCAQYLNTSSVELNEVRRIYEQSFPLDERREYSCLIDMLSDNKYFTLEALYLSHEVVGMFSSWMIDGWRYIEHFAIEASCRGRGIGREVLRNYLLRSHEPVVLEVELPTDFQSRRRIDFYCSMGFVLHDKYRYIQPSYGDGRNAVEMLLMTYGAPADCNLDELSRLLHAEVYGVRV